jgi:general secretion pathway protein G
MVRSLNARYFKQDEIRPAFTMIELIFVIVVLGILAAVAIPRLAASRDDAVLVKGKSQVAAIRSGISLLKSKRLLEGNATVIDELDIATKNVEGQNLFYGGAYGNILEYPILSKNSDGYWMRTGDPATYTFQVLNQTITFTYSSATGFDCNASNTTTGTNCKSLTQ